MRRGERVKESWLPRHSKGGRKVSKQRTVKNLTCNEKDFEVESEFGRNSRKLTS